MSEHITMPIGSTLEPDHLYEWQDKLEDIEIGKAMARMLVRVTVSK